MILTSGVEVTGNERRLHVWSEVAILPRRDVVAAAEQWHHTKWEPPHVHEFMEIVIVKTGTAVHRMRSGAVPIGPGSVLLMRPGQWHAYESPDDFRIWNLYIPANTLAGELKALRHHPVLASFTSGRITATVSKAHVPGMRPSNLAPSVDLSLIENYLLALAMSANEGPRSLSQLGHLLIVLDLLAPAFTSVNPESAVPTTHPAVLAATELLDAEPTRAWSLGEIAGSVHVSAPYLCRLFTKDLGISPLHYLERHRLELTAQLLLEGDLSISEISAATGWSDTNYMTRRFRALHGMPPTQYRGEFQRKSVAIEYRLARQAGKRRVI